jgi:hypothetical protein
VRPAVFFCARRIKYTASLQALRCIKTSKTFDDIPQSCQLISKLTLLIPNLKMDLIIVGCLVTKHVKDP